MQDDQLPPLPRARYWMTNEAAYRMEHGGNCKGSVPVHGRRSVAAKNGLFTEAQMHFFAAEQVAAERERWRGLLQEALDADTDDYIFGSDLADRMRAALNA